MKVKHCAASIVFAALAAFGGKAQAVFIGDNDIIPSTSLASSSGFTIDEIADGITSDNPPFNGFASNSSSGAIALDLVGNFDLTDFILWNDINVFLEGIKDFRLDFFDENNFFISSSVVFQAPLGQLASQTYSFSPVPCVSSVDLVVLNSHPDTFNRIEIREVAFEGEVCIPEPTSVMLFAAGALAFITFGSVRKKRGSRAMS